MDDYMAMGNNNPVSFKEFERFTSSGLQKATNKNHTAPVHPFFDLCEALKDKQEKLTKIFEQRLLRLKIELFQYVKDELRKRKEIRNILSFDDLLFNLQRAIQKGGEPLKENIRNRFRAALIDEFQDTDVIQYDIFKSLFDTKDNILFLIGDPKQAIYGFRGADIFAYMNAAAHAEFRHTLGENWRSEPCLISAVNTIFEHSDNAFVYNEINFNRVGAAKKPDPVFLKHKGESEPPLQLWFVNAGTGKPMTKGQAEKLISNAVAAEISRLLDRNNEISLGEARLREGDIAVLVRQHREAKLMQKALMAYKIPSVLHSDSNIFDSHEALEMERVLAGIVQPNSERFLRRALATDMMGVSGEELDEMTKDETQWEEWLVRFREYHDIWNKSGFIQMFRQVISKQDILPRLMALPDGERRNTNLLHLAEILHQTAVEKKLGMAWLVKWLSEQRDTETRDTDIPGAEQYQLRLESDDNAVKLVTIHKSKGLEYSVVFCPFIYGGSKISNKSKSFLFHDENDDRKLTLDMGSEDTEKNQVFAERELLAENLRLLYVAMTRAKNRCYLVWGRFNTAETSAPAYLFHHPDAAEDIVSATADKFKSLDDANILADLKAIQDKSDRTISLSEMPDEPGEPYSRTWSGDKLGCPKFQSKIHRDFRVSSFSSLTSGRTHGAELADHDAQAIHYDYADSEDTRVQEDLLNIFSFPKGPRPGTFMHEIFEHLDFTETDMSVVKDMIEEKLIAYDFDLKWRDTIYDMIQKTLSVNLDETCKDFKLSQIRNEDRLNELEFYFSLNRISPKRLKQIFEKYAVGDFSEDFPSYIEQLDFASVKGFMRGFVDMIFQFQGKFYLVDWKSNFLGPGAEDYNQATMLQAMKENFYILQYHIYTLALHRYLFARHPGYSYEEDFGGVYYIFLRGTEPNRPDLGIYRDRPPEPLINELCKNLIGPLTR